MGVGQGAYRRPFRAGYYALKVLIYARPTGLRPYYYIKKNCTKKATLAPNYYNPLIG